MAGSVVQFLEPDLKTPLPRKFTFADPEKIRELARRGEAWGASAHQRAKQILEHAIDTGRGGIYLRLLRSSVRNSGAFKAIPALRRACLAFRELRGRVIR
jgi:hypothetical protein